MVAEPHVFVHQLPGIGRKHFPCFSPAEQQDTTDDADGAFPMLLYLGKVLLQVGRNVLQICGVIFSQFVGAVVQNILQIIQ